jgi:GNAT superfamily N-acetyltransferase
VPEHADAATARRRGVGAALLAAAEAWARDRGCVYVVLDYNARNADAGRFYRDRMGYRPAGEIVLKEL